MISAAPGPTFPQRTLVIADLGMSYNSSTTMQHVQVSRQSTMSALGEWSCRHRQDLQWTLPADVYLHLNRLLQLLVNREKCCEMLRS